MLSLNLPPYVLRSFPPWLLVEGGKFRKRETPSVGVQFKRREVQLASVAANDSLLACLAKGAAQTANFVQCGK